MQLTAEEIKLIEKHRKQAELEKAMAWVPTAAEGYSPQEKCDKFDKLHEMALSHYNQIVETRYDNEDARYYFYEAVMGLLGKDVWKAVNAATTRRQG